MTTKLVYKGDLIENFGEFLPSPYIEQTRFYNDRIEVDVSIFLTDKEYGKVTDAGAYDIVMTQDFGASPSSDMGKFLQNYKNDSQGKNLGTPADSTRRNLMVYIAFEVCIKKGQCSSTTKPYPVDQLINEILNPSRDRPLYDYLYDGSDSEGNYPYLGIPFTDFVESDALLFAEDGTRIVQYKYTYTFYNPTTSFEGGVFGAATTATFHNSSGTSTFDSGNLVVYGFSSYIPKTTFEEMYGSTNRQGVGTKRQNVEALPVYQLAKGQFSDVTYEVLLEGTVNSSGVPLKMGDLKTHIVTWVDDAGAVYPRAPIRDISGRHRKVGPLSGEDIKTEFESMINEFRQVTSMDEEAQNAADEVLSILQTYSGEPKSEIPGTHDNDISGGPAILVMEKLQTLRKMWPNKSQGTTAGKLYHLFKSLIGNVQARLVKQEAVRKRKQANLKIFDLRFDANEVDYTPGIHEYLAYDETDYFPLIDRGLEGSMIKFEGTDVESSYNLKDIMPFDFAPESSIRNITDEAGDKPYTVFRRAYFFFDFEKALYMHSLINKTFNVPVLERWFGKSIIQSKYIISQARVQKYSAELDSPSTIKDYLRTWQCQMYSNNASPRPNVPSTLLFPDNAQQFTNTAVKTNTDHNHPYKDRLTIDGRRVYGHLMDYDESVWYVSPDYRRNSGNGDIYLSSDYEGADGTDYRAGMPNALTKNRKFNLAVEDGEPLGLSTYVATPPLPLPKYTQTDNKGYEANIPYVPYNRRGVFPGAYNRMNDTNTAWGHAMLVPRNIAGIGGASAFNREVGGDSDDYMTEAHHTEYASSTGGFKTFSPVYQKPGDEATVSPSIAPYGYRMATFEFNDIYAGENNEWLAMETGQHIESLIKYRARVRVRDYTGAIARALMDSYDDVVNGAFREYVEMATEYCAYNQVDDSFTAYFADAITEFYRESHPEWTPWFKAPLVYFLHRDLLYQEFGGGSKSAKDAVRASAISLAEKISPYTGNLASLLAFQRQMQELYDYFYGPGGEIFLRLQTLEEAGEFLDDGSDGLLLEWERILHLHTSADNADASLSTAGDSSTSEDGDGVPWPIDITQQGDVEDFAEWDVTVDIFDHDPVCQYDGAPPGMVDASSTWEAYLGACTKTNGLLEPGEGTTAGEMTFAAIGDGLPDTKKYFYPGAFGLSGTGGETVTGNTHDFTNNDFGLDDELTQVGDRAPHYASTATDDDGVPDAEATWEDCFCYCRPCDNISPHYCIDGGWINVLRVQGPDEDSNFTADRVEKMSNHLIYLDGDRYVGPYGIQASRISGPPEATYIMAAVDVYDEDTEINLKFLRNIKRAYLGLKPYGTRLSGMGDVTVPGATGPASEVEGAEVSGLISEGEFEGMHIDIFTELTRHPGGGSAQTNPGGLASEGDNGQRALGFCLQCRQTDAGADRAGVVQWMPREGGDMTTYTSEGSDDYRGPRIDCYVPFPDDGGQQGGGGQQGDDSDFEYELEMLDDLGDDGGGGGGGFGGFTGGDDGAGDDDGIPDKIF